MAHILEIITDNKKVKKPTKRRKRRKKGDFSKDYLDYLDSHAWAAKRAKVLERDNHQCVKCGAQDKLHVHHKTYRRLGNENLADLITVCQICHERIHHKAIVRKKRVESRTFIKYLPKKRGRNKKGNKTAGYGCAPPKLIRIPLAEWRAKYGKKRARAR